jgi:hypothetical protein
MSLRWIRHEKLISLAAEFCDVLPPLPARSRLLKMHHEQQETVANPNYFDCPEEYYSIWSSETALFGRKIS